MALDRLAAQRLIRRSGQETFLSAGQELVPSQRLLDFWRWSGSDLLVNTMRGLVAEYLVALALGVADNPRVEWEPYDLLSPTGVKVEVKSTARFQSWVQAYPSPLEFGIAKTQPRDSTNKPVGERRRHADIYVFCVLDHIDEALDPLNLDHWKFYVLPTSTLNARLCDQKQMRLSTLRTLEPSIVPFEELKETIHLRAGS